MINEILHGWKETMGHVATKQRLPQLRAPNKPSSITNDSDSTQVNKGLSSCLKSLNESVQICRTVHKRICARILPLFTTVVCTWYSFQEGSSPTVLSVFVSSELQKPRLYGRNLFQAEFRFGLLIRTM